MTATLALLPSPLLGGVACQPLADALVQADRDVVLTGLPHEVTDPAAVLETFVSSVGGPRDVVLVPHSNAGLYAPEVARRVGATATVFVDAALPPPGPLTRLAPPGLREQLGRLADDDGRLPPWTRWWGDDDLEGLFPPGVWRERVESAQPRLPLAYFDATLPVPEGWEHRPCAYLAFGETYDDEVARARELGWPVRVLEGRHLHMLFDPAGVARSILGLLDRLTSPGPG
ncbi:MAG TPA: alpha/beta fold hydrolase [Nocardioides sp.]|nr:alpha/beta fold hydrolase [Nocardioides sp.]